MDSSQEPVTVVGLGAMGTALARAFLGAGHPTTVWNRTAKRADDLVAVGAVRAESVAAAAAASPVVVICVLDNALVRELLDPISDQLAGHSVVNLTSSTPESARDTARWAVDHRIDYLDGAIMVPTPLIGGPEALLLYSGSLTVHDAQQSTLASLGGRAEFLGTDPGLASLYDLGMLDMLFAGMTSFLHASALVGADGVSARTFLPYADRSSRSCRRPSGDWHVTWMRPATPATRTTCRWKRRHWITSFTPARPAASTPPSRRSSGHWHGRPSTEVMEATGSPASLNSSVPDLTSGRGEPGDVPPLPRRLDRTSVVALADECHRRMARHTVQHRNAGQGSTGPAAPAATGDLHPLRLGAVPGLPQRILRVTAVRR